MPDTRPPADAAALDELRRDSDALAPWLPPQCEVRLAPASRDDYSASAEHPWGCTLPLQDYPTGARVQPQMSVLHTPETPRGPDAVTPRLFEQPGFGASTHAFIQAAERPTLWLMVPLQRYAWAQGTSAKTTRLPRPTWWRPAMRSYNCVGLSVEVQGHAAESGHWMTRETTQWATLVGLLAGWHTLFGYPPIRARVVGHGQLSTLRSDPGPRWPWAALLDDVRRRMIAGRLSTSAAVHVRAEVQA